MKYKFVFVTALIVALTSANLWAQARGGGAAGVAGQRGEAPQPPQTPREMAPIDLTGYWVSMVTEDWRFRMIAPVKGDYLGVPLNAEGRRVADEWDPARDEAAGEQCKSYGAANIMRVPQRLHISWDNDQTLKLETDAGTQTRLFYFGTPQGQGGTWQGLSKASWEFDAGFGLPAERFDRGFGTQVRPKGGALKVVTTKLRPGYLRKNGIPYSANAVVTEYFDRITEPNGDVYLVVTMEVEDPTRFGVVEGTEDSDGLVKVKRLVEKPAQPSSKLAIMPVYVFDSSIFRALESTAPGFAGELQLTDGIQKMVDWGLNVYSTRVASGEVRLDVGSPDLYWEAQNLSHKHSSHKSSK